MILKQLYYCSVSAAGTHPIVGLGTRIRKAPDYALPVCRHPISVHDCTDSQPSLAPSAQRKRPHLVVHYDQPVEEQRGIRDLLGIVDKPFGGLGRPRSGFLRPDNSCEGLKILYQPQVVRSYYPVENTTSSKQTLKKCFIRTSIKSCLVQLESSCKPYRASQAFRLC